MISVKDTGIGIPRDHLQKVLEPFEQVEDHLTRRNEGTGLGLPIAKALIELATRRFIEEVPALEPIKLVVGIEMRGRGDVQHFRLELPDVKVTKGPAADARVRVDMRREFFNVMAREGKVPDWIEAFTYGQAKATGPEQILKLIVNVVERQQERQRARKARKAT